MAQRLIFHTFNLGDVEDPDIYAASPIYEWQQTEWGQWVMKHGKNLQYIISTDVNIFGYKVVICGYLNPKDEVYYTLKYK